MGRIYRYVGEDNLIKYVGKVDGDDLEDVRRRISEHKHIDIWSSDEKFKVEVSDYITSSPLETFIAETHFINKYGTGRFYNKNYQVNMGSISWISKEIDNCTWSELKPFKCERKDSHLPSYLQEPFDKRKKQLVRNMFIYHFERYKGSYGRLNDKGSHEQALDAIMNVISAHFPALFDEDGTQFASAFSEWQQGRI